jgi:signal transduction histidine kinase
MDEQMMRLNNFMIPNDNQENLKYYEFKLETIEFEDKVLKIIQVQNVTSRVMFDLLTNKQHILETINATVSHEMRNPLNSISS